MEYLPTYQRQCVYLPSLVSLEHPISNDVPLHEVDPTTHFLHTSQSSSRLHAYLDRRTYIHGQGETQTGFHTYFNSLKEEDECTCLFVLARFGTNNRWTGTHPKESQLSTLTQHTFVVKTLLTLSERTVNHTNLRRHPRTHQPD